jgi:hypothetical protein
MAAALFWLMPLEAWCAQRHDSSGASIRVQMHNIRYHFTDAVAIQINDLDGSLVPSEGNPFPIFDDKNSFRLQIDSAQISITPESLGQVLNSYVFARSDAPLKNIDLAIDQGELRIKGKLHSKGDIPFEMEGRLTPTEDGRIRVHAENIKALHLPVKGVMDLFGVTVAALVKTDKLQGISVDKDDLLLNPEQLLPPPHIKGRVTRVRLDAGGIALTLGNAAPQERILKTGNYMGYFGNRLRFGKLTMSDTDMILIDMDPKDPFDFDLDDYLSQLVAGYTKITPQFGLRVYMRDYNRVHGGVARKAPK